jgi:16S rRNA (guanine527-N7)-methyltransferase
MKNRSDNNWKLFFQTVASDLNINLNEKEVELFEIYLNELQEWNKKINLTSIRDTDDIILKHFYDSLTLLYHVPLSGKIVDLGSGGGFPGIPIKIIAPFLEVLLIESVRKKANFLNHIIGSLNLKGIEVFNGRAEDFPGKEYFDYAVSRAFGSLKIYLKTAIPLVKNGGYIVAMKGRNVDGELEEAQKKFHKTACLHNKISFDLPLNAGKRTIIVFKKEKCFT